MAEPKRKVVFRKIRGRIVPIHFKYPGSETEYVLNPKAPRLKLERHKGKYAILRNGKYVKGSTGRLRANIRAMTFQVKQAEAGRRLFQGYGAERKVSAIPSTFPSFFREAEFRTKKEWMSAIKRRKGEKYEKIAGLAYEDLLRHDPVIGIRGKQVFYKDVKFITMKVKGKKKVIPIRQDDASFNFGMNKKAVGF